MSRALTLAPATYTRPAFAARLTRRAAWLAGLTYAEASRAHTFDGALIASVTQVLEQAGKTDFSKVKTQVLQRKGLIGTAAHQAAHYYDEGDLETASVDGQVAPYLDSWRLFREERRFDPLCLETVVFSRRYGYTGRLDRVGTVRGRPGLVLLDIKTGDPAAARADLQLMAYDLALEEEFGAEVLGPLERWSVQIFQTGRYAVHRYPIAPRSWRHDRAEFLEALSLARAHRGLTWRSRPMTNLPDTLPLDDLPPEPPPLEDLRDILPDHPPAEALPDEPPDAPPVSPASSDSGDVQAQLEQRRDTVVMRAGVLARSLSDQASCEAAVHYATFVDDALREAHAYFDPLVERARQPYQDRLAERKAVIEPLEAAKGLLVGQQGAVTRWLQAQKRQAEAKARDEQRIADEAAAKDRARLAEEAKQVEQQAAAAAQAGDADRAQELQRDAAGLVHQAQQTVAAPVRTEAPTVAGVSGRKNWTAEVLSTEALVVAIARPTVLKEVLTWIQAIEGWETATGRELVTSLDVLEGQTPDVPVAAVEPNLAYLRTRAKADEGTLAWPGVRFYDAGSSALAPASRRRK